MPSFPDSIFLFVLALLLFGPKRLPVLAREIGKWVGEFRRASNDFKMQMEDELRATEQSDRQKQISAMEAAAPVAPPIGETEASSFAASTLDSTTDSVPEISVGETAVIEPIANLATQSTYEVVDGVRTPLPIATSGELRIMPPSTGLPTPQEPRNSALRGLLDAIPPVAENNSEILSGTETSAHGD